MFYWLKLIRAFDERLSILVKQGKVRSGVYTGIGQEAIIVGTCFGLRKEDFVCPLHRDMGSFLMKGVTARTMMAQMFAKVGGLSQGRDSALHSGVTELGIFGNTSMLGGNLPVAAGLGLTFKMENVDNVVIAYFGEGASNTGDFHEAMNIAGVKRLPIIFVCENNQYAYSVPLEKSMAIDDVAGRARATASTASPSTATTSWPSIRRPRAPSRAREKAKARRSLNARRIAGTATPSTTRRSIERTKSWQCGRAAIRFRPSRRISARDMRAGRCEAGEGRGGEDHVGDRRGARVCDERAGSETSDAVTDLYA